MQNGLPKGSNSPGFQGAHRQLFPRWTSRQQFLADFHTFNVTSDDGVRLYVDDILVLDSWQPMHGSTSVKHYLTTGEHTVVLEYFEGTGVAQVRLEWYPLSEGTAAEQLSINDFALSSGKKHVIKSWQRPRLSR